MKKILWFLLIAVSALGQGVVITPGVSVSSGTLNGIGGSSAIICGPPMYICSSSNIGNVVALKATPPFTGLTGAPGYNPQPEPGNPGGILNAPMYRLTDYPFAIAHINNAGKSMQPNCSGNGFDRQWEMNDAFMVSCDNGKVKYLWSVNQNTNPITFSFITTLSSTVYGTAPNFATTTSNRMYFGDNTITTQLDFASALNPNVATALFDFASVCPSWNNTFGINMTDPPLSNYGDTSFATGFSPVTTQDTGRIIAVYSTFTHNCYFVNTSTMQVFGPSGLIGTYSVSHGTFRLHQVTGGLSGAVEATRSNVADNFVLTHLVPGGSCSTSCTVTVTYTPMSDGTQAITGESFTLSLTTNYNNTYTIASATSSTFQITVTGCAACGTETSGKAVVNNDNGSDPFVYFAGAGDLALRCNTALYHPADCSGHFVSTFSGFVNDYNQSQMVYKLNSTPGQPVFTFPVGDPCSGHQSVWDNHPDIYPKSTDTNAWVMFGSTSGNTLADYTKPCTMEMIGYLLSGTVTNVKRFGHNYSNRTWAFDACNNILGVSQTGKFMSFSSTMQDTLGNITGGSTVTTGTVCGGNINGTGGNARSDLFVLYIGGQ